MINLSWCMQSLAQSHCLDLWLCRALCHWVLLFYWPLLTLTQQAIPIYSTWLYLLLYVNEIKAKSYAPFDNAISLVILFCHQWLAPWTLYNTHFRSYSCVNFLAISSTSQRHLWAFDSFVSFASCQRESRPYFLGWRSHPNWRTATLDTNAWIGGERPVPIRLSMDTFSSYTSAKPFFSKGKRKH